MDVMDGDSGDGEPLSDHQEVEDRAVTYAVESP